MESLASVINSSGNYFAKVANGFQPLYKFPKCFIAVNYCCNAKPLNTFAKHSMTVSQCCKALHLRCCKGPGYLSGAITWVFATPSEYWRNNHNLTFKKGMCYKKYDVLSHSQRRIQRPISHLRWKVLQKWLTAFTCELF